MSNEIRHPVAKAASSLGVGASVQAAEAATHQPVAMVAGWTIGELASLAALLYSSCLLIEWLWKRVLKPLAQRRGWIKPKGKPADFLDSTGAVPLDP